MKIQIFFIVYFNTSVSLWKLLTAPFSTEQLLWLLFNTSNSLFKDVSAISLTHSQSLLTCNSHNDKLIWKSIHLPNLDINNFAVLLHFLITKFSRNCPYLYFFSIRTFLAISNNQSFSCFRWMNCFVRQVRYSNTDWLANFWF